MRPRELAAWAIRWYQRELSGRVGRTCRYEPSCSEYALKSVLEFGILLGGGLAYARYLRCYSKGASGSDPPPRTTNFWAVLDKVQRATRARRGACSIP